MNEAERQILQMVENGVITAEEADKLLAALGPDDQVSTVAGEAVKSSSPYGEEGRERPDHAPELDRFRGFLGIPLMIAAGSLIISGLGLFLLYQSTGEIAALGFLCIWSMFIVALMATLLIFFARRAPWVHVRVQERDGRRIAISLPLPMGIAGWGLGIARRFVPEEQAAHMDTAAAFVQAMREGPGKEPIVIDVNDDDGDKVQVYIG